MKDLKISAITVSYNQGPFIRQTIESVMLQRYPNFEHIIIDGGSTDTTIQSLKAYPHLNWVSEPDRGQSHALNKGFRKATGDIIAWINSDDWYPPGTFKDVALALEDYPIVLGGCEVTDKYGTRKQVFNNFERNWFDILKYWIFESMLSQPSVFFRRDLLEQVKLPNGNYIDEDLEYCMDYDLFLRMAKIAPPVRRINKVFSYVRDYDTNKTGSDMAGTYREMRRVYRRHATILSGSERAHSFIIPLRGDPTTLDVTLSSISSQTLPDLEALIVYTGEDKTLARAIKRKVIALGERFKDLGLRFTTSETSGFFPALNWAMRGAAAPLVTVLAEGDVLPEFYALEAAKRFQVDNLALSLPFGDKPEFRKIFEHQQGNQIQFRPDGIFLTPFICPRFTARKAALLDCDMFKPTLSNYISPVIAFRQLMLRFLYKGWQIISDDLLRVHEKGALQESPDQLLEVFRNYINSYVILGVHQEYETDSFARTRAQHGFTVLFPDNIKESARKLLTDAPFEWYNLEALSQPETQNKLTQTHPNFAPAWYFKMVQLQQSGNLSLADTAAQQFQAARQKESQY